MNTIAGYHFTGTTLRNGDPIPKVGRWLRHVGPIVACSSGLHASEHPFDALQYAPGTLLHKVDLRRRLVAHGDPIDKWVGRERRILATVDAEPMLRGFARWCALSVIHLWEAPDVVRRFLLTGDESIRAAAWDAAAAGARATAWAARAAWDAACDAARAELAAWDAARAAWDAAAAAASAAAAAAARMAQRLEFLRLVDAAFTREIPQ